MQKILISIVEDSKTFSNTLKKLLNLENDLETLFVAYDGADFFVKLEKSEVTPDIVFMDLSMPYMDGIEASKKLKGSYPRIKVIIMSNYDDESFVREMMKYNIEGYLLKRVDFEEVIRAIHRVFKGGSYYCNEILETIKKRPVMPKEISQSETLISNLSKREKEIVTFICDARTAKEIANKLGISERTVEKHRNNILKKVNARNSIELILLALKSGEYLASIEPRFKLNGNDNIDFHYQQ